MKELFKMFKRTLVVELTSLHPREFKILMEMANVYKIMVNEIIERIVSEGIRAARKVLHKHFYNEYTQKYLSFPLRVIKSAYIITGRIVKSSEKLVRANSLASLKIIMTGEK